ncbi:MAG: aminotransferase class V-fold PLP-dependent enzyme [Cyanobacteria bacterium P01_D01_bin.73]
MGILPSSSPSIEPPLLLPSDRRNPIYLDAHATTPVDPRVLEAMIPFFTQQFGNSGSSTHSYGWAAQSAVDQAREALASAIGASAEEIIFTSGATEANNLAIKGVAEAYLDKGRHIVTVVTEHTAVLNPCRYLESLGWRVTYLPVDPQGLIDTEQLEGAIAEDTVLVSVMAANNEIGVLQPLDEIGRVCRDRQVLFHTDAAQAIGKVPLNVDAQNIDLMSITAHKIYGPKGIGALYVRRRPRVNLAPQLHGGGQERGWRSGTLCVPLIVGLAEAVALGIKLQGEENQRIQALRDRLWNQLKSENSGITIYLNGHTTQRLAGNLNVSVAEIKAADLLRQLRSKVALSSGSACSSTAQKLSHVLKALGDPDRQPFANLRFGIGRFNTADEVDIAAQLFVEAVRSQDAS